MRRLFKFRYPKLLALFFVIIIAYVIFSNDSVGAWVSGLGDSGYIAVFIFGMLFTFGFTTPFAIGFFITLNLENIWIAGFVAGTGALIMDLVLFKFLKFSFADEFYRLENTHIVKRTSVIIRKEIGRRLQAYLVYAFAGIV